MLKGCSYENDFPVDNLLNRENRYHLHAFTYEIFPRFGEIYFGGLLGAELCRVPIFKTGEINFRKNVRA